MRWKGKGRGEKSEVSGTLAIKRGVKGRGGKRGKGGGGARGGKGENGVGGSFE